VRESGKVSPAKAARLLGLHYNTVYAYCRAAVSGRPSRLVNVSQNPVSGYYQIDLHEVNSLRNRKRGSIL
jgi:hypothetical protein